MPAVSCPTCREELDIPSEFIGREVRCSVCRNVFLVPQSSEPPVMPRRASTIESSENRSLEDDTAPRPRKRRGSLTWVLTLFGILSCCGVGCGGSVILIALIANPTFQPYTAPDGTFEVAFPGKAKAVQDTTDEGLARESVEARRKFPPEFYFVQHVPIKGKKAPEILLQEAADKSVKRVAGGIETRRTTNTVDGYPAIDVLIEHGNGQQVTILRHIVVGDRLYTLGIVGPQGLDFPIEYVDRFFSSFQVKKKPLN